MRREDPAAALPFLQRAVALGDSEGLTLGLLAYCRLQQQHYSSALQAYRLAQLTMPESPDWKAGEAECLRQTGDHAAAIRLFTEVLAVRPGDHETWIRLAHAQMNLDRHDQAAASLEMVRRLGRLTPPDTLLLGRIFLQLRSPTLALSRFSEAVAAEPPPEVGAVIEAADLLSQTLAWNETATLLQQIRSRFPDITALPENGDLERLEALLEMETGDPKAAAARLVEIVNRDPMDGRVLVTLGRHLAAEGDFVDAEMRLTQASKVPAFEAPALRELGQLHVTQGDYGAALEQLRRAQALEPDDSLARYIHAVEHAQAAAAGL
jgi:tetratricopeptide (TPR) repeat protein